MNWGVIYIVALRRNTAVLFWRNVDSSEEMIGLQIWVNPFETLFLLSDCKVASQHYDFRKKVRLVIHFVPSL